MGLTENRLDGLAINTPGKRSAIKKRNLETPSVSRVRGEHAASSPDQRSSPNVKDQLDSLGALP